MSFTVTKSAGPCGATVSGLDLSARLSKKTITELRQTWLEHKVLAFPDQAMANTDLEKFTRYFGDFGDDPYFEPIDGHDHIAAICRRAEETVPVFAEVWHTDWSFQKVPPAGTCLYGITIPPVGGQTLFIDQQKALNEMPHELRARIEGKWAIHSARGGYAPDGAYGEREKGSDRSMKIIYSQDAYATQAHPFIRQHPETGEETLYGILGYIIAVQDMPQEQAKQLLPKSVKYFKEIYSAAENADAVVLMTEWSQYISLDMDLLRSKMKGSAFIDLRNLYHPEEMRKLGFDYFSIGRP